MNFDISPLLNSWEYRPGKIDVRRFKGRDGVEKIQLRVDLGLLQLNASGRPDGKRPYGCESLFEHYEARMSKHEEEHGDDGEFELDADDCARLQQEAIQYHHRYICLFQLEDFAGVIRDTERNLRVFDFVEHFAESEEMANALQQFRPQLLMMQTRALGAMALAEDDHPRAIQAVRDGIEQIRQFFIQRARPDLADQSSEVQSLEAWQREIDARRPLTERERLEKALDEAVRNEDFEKAAQVRDTLRNFKASR